MPFGIMPDELRKQRWTDPGEATEDDTKDGFERLVDGGVYNNMPQSDFEDYFRAGWEHARENHEDHGLEVPRERVIEILFPGEIVEPDVEQEDMINSFRIGYNRCFCKGNK